MTAPTKYSDEFKANAVARFIQAKKDGTPTIVSIAKELGVSDALLFSWHAKATGKAAGNKSAKNRAKAKKRREAQAPTRTQYPIALKQQAVAMVRTGMKAAAVARELGLEAYLINHWKKNGILRGAADAQDDGKAQSVVAAPSKPVNGIGSGGAITDALIYLRHAEKEILEMIRDGKISRPDQAHLLTLLALGALQKAIAK